jgi:hypothetical protein
MPEASPSRDRLSVAAVSTSETAAWIGFAGGLVGALASALVSRRQSKMDERLARVNHELELDAQRRAAALDRAERAEEVLTRYREPLAAAAFDLQSRLFNLLRLDFLGKFANDGDRAEEAITTTLFRFCQYFGWTEILRRDIQFLSFPEDDETRLVATLQSNISRGFLTDRYGRSLMVWGDQQRALGESMITEEHGKVLCMGYATFCKRRDRMFAMWRERLVQELGDDGAQARLRDIQHLLCDLVEALDRQRVRYTEDLDRA